MYIIAGKLKRKKLTSFKNKSIRPAMALIRKSVFDTLSELIEDAEVLDLCAGTGIVGIEAISRGAKNLTLVDSDRRAVEIIFKNLDICNIKAKVILGNLPSALGREIIKEKKYNLIFLDPPYGKSNFIEDVLKKIIDVNILLPDGMIIIESELKSKFEIPEELKLYREKIYGNTKITMLRLTTINVKI